MACTYGIKKAFIWIWTVRVKLRLQNYGFRDKVVKFYFKCKKKLCNIQEKSCKYIEDMLKSKEHMTRAGIIPLYITATFDPFPTHPLCIFVTCTLFKGMYQIELD